MMMSIVLTLFGSILILIIGVIVLSLIHCLNFLNIVTFTVTVLMII